LMDILAPAGASSFIWVTENSIGVVDLGVWPI
jgi:hypothetical protein